MTSPARRLLRAKKKSVKARQRKDEKVMVRRKADLSALPHTIREWAKEVLSTFEAKGLAAGQVMPKRPDKRTGNLWRIVFVLSAGIQCAECGELSNDGEARYTIFHVGDIKWLSASCIDCHNSREPGSAQSPQQSDV